MGTAIFIPIAMFLPFVDWMQAITDNIPQQIANTHIVFNLVSTAVLLPAAPLLVKAANFLIPGKDKAFEPMQLQYLDQRILATPPIAVAQVIKESERMAVLARQEFHDSIEYFFKPNSELLEKVTANKQVLDYLNKEITSYLIKISALELPASDSKAVGALFHTINDFQRIGDHAENIIEAGQAMQEGKLSLSENAVGEMKEMSLRVEVLLDEALHMFRTRVYDEELATAINRSEEEVDQCTEEFRNNHIRRLTKHKCTPEQGVVFLDILGDLERVADHATNIAFSLSNQ